MSSLLSAEYKSYVEQGLARREELLAPIAGEVAAALEGLEGEDERVLLKGYLATLPLEDAFDAGVATLASFARQAARLRAESPWCSDVPEDVFVHYVACPRVNNERVADAWPALHEPLAPRLEGLDAASAVLEVNHWCCEVATYQASDGRTLGPLGMLASGSGRCGEESTLLVSALRSVGIPARQLYAPWWAHCDDNHAWVEAYTGDGWHYLGACEPEEALDRGWFTAASGRAIVVHTRLFGDFGCDFERDGHLLAREGCQVIVNLTDRYAPTTTLAVRVTDAGGQPVEGADVCLRILNEAVWRDVASLVTDASGVARALVGEGTLRVCASRGDELAELTIDTAERSEVTLGLGAREVCADGSWTELDVRAPSDHPAPSQPLTPEQAAAGRARKRADDLARTRRVSGMLEAARALAAGEGLGEGALPYLELAFGNAPEVARFLGADDGADRAELLSTLASKDFRDLRADVLEDHVAGARLVREDALSYLAREGCTDAAEAEGIFRRYVLCPRIHFEGLAPWRALLCSWLGDELGAKVVADPAVAWEVVADRTSFSPSEHVRGVVGSPRCAVLSGQAGEEGRRLLFVAVCRTMGVPARVNPADGGAEYWRDGGFVPVEGAGRLATVTVTSADDPEAGYYQTWGLARLERGLSPAGAERTSFRELDLRGVALEGGSCDVTLPLGAYRLTTASRLPSGDTQAAERELVVGEGGVAEGAVELLVRRPDVSQLLSDIPLDHLALGDERGGALDVSAVARAGSPLVVAFLEPGMEPTEHLLNEMREQAGRLAAAGLPLVLAVPGPESLDDLTLARTLPALDGAVVAYDDFSELPERLARRMFVNPEKLPLCILAQAGADGLRGRYAAAGYNVGTVDLVLKLVPLL